MRLIHETACFRYYRTRTGYARVSKFGEGTEILTTSVKHTFTTIRTYFNLLRQNPDKRFSRT